MDLSFGGPVFVLLAGETNGEDRLPILQKGILKELAAAHNGVAVILEHRYYGRSVPTSDLSTENLRFLTTEQALADVDYFARTVNLVADQDLHAGSTPWIVYGGSYAGSMAALLRVKYPETFYGGISSSGVPAAIWDYWEYYEAARIFGPETCSRTQGKLTNIIDKVLLNETDTETASTLKTVFGLDAKTSNPDFASAISGGISALQSYNWDPEISSDEFFTYCDTISKDKSQYPELESNRSFVEEIVAKTGYADDSDPLVERLLNYIGYQRFNSDSEIKDISFYQQDDLNQTWRLWPYQVCTEYVLFWPWDGLLLIDFFSSRWGFLQTGSGAPDDILPMISRTIDLEYSSQICRDAFNITEPADTDRINKYGGFNISHSRLAFVDGQWDPWRAAGVHALTQPERNSTVDEPYLLIDGGVHHWDENGVRDNETAPGFPPKAVVMAKRQIRDFVGEWISTWPEGKD